MKSFTTNEIVNAFKRKNYRLKEGVLQLNLFGIRNTGSQANTFDDILGGIYKDSAGNWQVLQFDGTTDPGTYFRESPMNVNGTCIMVPGQNLNCYKIGTHRGDRAFQQIGKMAYVRDKNKNKILDYFLYLTKGNIIYEIAATNMHNASENHTSTNVDKWSAGCQVHATAANLDRLLNIAQSGLDTYNYPNVFDYTLFESAELLRP